MYLRRYQNTLFIKDNENITIFLSSFGQQNGVPKIVSLVELGEILPKEKRLLKPLLLVKLFALLLYYFKLTGTF